MVSKPPLFPTAMNIRFVPVFRLALLGSLTSAVLAGTTYNLVDLGPGEAKDVNAAGKVVGNSATGGWYHDGTTRSALAVPCRYFGAPPEQVFNQVAASANAINDTGVIVGHVVFPGPFGGTITPFVLRPGAVGTLVGGFTAGTGVNTAGTAVGGSGSAAFVFDGTAVVTPGGFNPRPYAINDSGVVVGSVAPDGFEVAAKLDAAGATLLDLSALGLPAAGPGDHYSSQALAVNGAGVVVGQVNLSTAHGVAGTWAFVHANGKAAGLGSLGGSLAVANDINSSGTVVGQASVAAGELHAFVHAGGVMSDLNTLVASGGAGWVLTSANAVNDSGVIVGRGVVGGETRAFLLRPTTAGVAPSIAIHPVGASVFAGEPFSLSVTASGTPPLSYQWQHAGTNLPAATAATLSVAHATPDDADAYRVVVGNAFGSATSDPATVVVKVLAELDIAMYAGLQVSGPVGKTFRIEAVEHAGETQWQALATVTLETSPTFWLDRDTPLHRTRLYRAVPVSP